MFTVDNKNLFYDRSLQAELDGRTAEVIKRIQQLPKEQLLSIPEKDIVNDVAGQLEIEPLVIKKLERDEPEEVLLDRRNLPGSGLRDNSGPRLVHGTRLTLRLPYNGFGILWNIMLSSQVLPNHPRGIVEKSDIRNGILKFVLEQRADDDPEGFKKDINENMSRIKSCLTIQTNEIKRANEEIINSCHAAIRSRKQRLEKQNELIEILDIPLKHTKTAPHFIDMKRVEIEPLPPTSDEKLEQQWGIKTEEYEYILKIIRHMCRTFETTPLTFQGLDEEDLRNIIIASLNGYYEGGASGETFRSEGKTHIRIEKEDRAAFVAELKVWTGEKKLKGGIDQLLGYLTWRDCKTSYVIFNKNNKKFIELHDSVRPAIQSHESFKKELGCDEHGEWRFVFKSPEDEDQEITIHVMLLDLFCE